MDYILHLDAATDVCGVALSLNGKLLTLISSTENRNHAASINIQIEQALAANNIKMADIKAVAVCAGPGSYTGLRIAMASAKGICYALDIPLICNNRLHLIAASHPSSHDAQLTTVALVAREGEFFTATYNTNNECVTEPTHILANDLINTLQKIENVHIITDIAELENFKLSVKNKPISTDVTFSYDYWSEIAHSYFKQGIFADVMKSTPMYLKQVFTHK